MRRALAWCLLVACNSGLAPTPSPDPLQPSPNGPVLPSSAEPSSPPPGSVTTIDDSCASDGDCELTSTDLEEGPNAHRCCPGCTERAVNRNWLAKFRNDCGADAPRMCPPLGCPMPIVHAVCQAGHCAAVE